MARGFSKAIIIGNVVRDPETRATTSGSEVTSFSVAVNYNYVMNVPPWKSSWKTLTYSVADPKNLPPVAIVKPCQILFRMIFQMAKSTSVKYHSNN